MKGESAKGENRPLHDLQQLITAANELRRLGVLVNQSLRVSAGRDVDAAALQQAAKQINQLWPCPSK